MRHNMRVNIDRETDEELEEILINKRIIKRIIESDDPDFLNYIIRSNYNHQLSQLATSNSNCSPEILKEVLKRGDNDQVSHNAARNPNCPIESLIDVYCNRHNLKYVILGAISNINCPIYILFEIINSKETTLHQLVYNNPSCPKYLKKELTKNDNLLYTEVKVVQQKEDLLKI